MAFLPACPPSPTPSSMQPSISSKPTQYDLVLLVVHATKSFSSNTLAVLTKLLMLICIMPNTGGLCSAWWRNANLLGGGWGCGSQHCCEGGADNCGN